MVTKTKIEQVRKKIDKIDDQILELIQKRERGIIEPRYYVTIKFN